MNRRAFFGFACGGVAAAPATVLGAQKPVKAEVGKLEIGIEISDTGHLKAYVADVARTAVKEAQREAMRSIRNFDTMRG